MRKASRILSFASLLWFLSPAIASADTVGPIKVASVGVQGGQMFITSPNLPAACGNILYLALNSGNAEYVMSLVLSARLSGISLGRIDYTPGSPCTIYLAQM